jgi:vacuolar-type H+-ATPase subunit D/Vma8
MFDKDKIEKKNEEYRKEMDSLKQLLDMFKGLPVLNDKQKELGNQTLQLIEEIDKEKQKHDKFMKDKMAKLRGLQDKFKQMMK